MDNKRDRNGEGNHEAAKRRIMYTFNSRPIPEFLRITDVEKIPEKELKPKTVFHKKNIEDLLAYKKTKREML